MSEYDRKVAQATEELAKELQYKRASGVAWSQLEIEYDLLNSRTRANGVLTGANA